MKSKVLLFALFLTLSGLVSAQDYQTSIGLRGGLANGISIKHFARRDIAIEGIISTHLRGFQFTGMGEFHASAFGARGLEWFYGGGGHVGFYSYWDGHPFFSENYVGMRAVAGLDAILGFEYTLRELPLCLQLDWKPVYNLSGHKGFMGDGAGITIRYTLP